MNTITLEVEKSFIIIDNIESLLKIWLLFFFGLSDFLQLRKHIYFSNIAEIVQ